MSDCGHRDPITLIGPGYGNYVVETTAMIEGQTQKKNGTAYVSVCARQQKPFNGWCPVRSLAIYRCSWCIDSFF